MLHGAGRGRKKGQNCLCTHCIPGYLYRVKGGGLCRLHVSAWWELLNYGWMFLITPHKCWNITLCQCLEDEEGGLRRLACLGKHWLALNHGGPCVMALEMWLWEKSEHSFCWREGEEMGNKTKGGGGGGRAGGKELRRRAGASDSGIHLIAPKWKRFLASHLLCLKKEKEKSSRIPHVYQPTSHSAMWALIPPAFRCGAISNIVINIEKAAVHRP